MMTESIRFTACAAQMVHSNPDCVTSTVHKETTCTVHMQEFWCLPETSDSSHTCWKVDPNEAWNLWWRNYSSLFFAILGKCTLLKFHHTALPEIQQGICREIETLDSPTITVIRTAILQRDQRAKLPWQQTLGVAELQKAVSLQEKCFEDWFNPGS